MFVVVRRRSWSMARLPVVCGGGKRVGVATYMVEDGRAELITLDVLREGAAVGGT
jgi:hypothetical protein